MQGFEPFTLVVGSARSFAIDGNELVAVRPERGDPALETTAKQDGVDPVEESAQPALTGDAVMELAKATQKIDMVFAPSHDIVEIVTAGVGAADHQKQHLLEWKHHPPRLAIIFKDRKMLQKQGHASPRGLFIKDRGREDVHDCAPCRIRAPRESQSSSQHKITQNGPLT